MVKCIFIVYRFTAQMTHQWLISMFSLFGTNFVKLFSGPMWSVETTSQDQHVASSKLPIGVRRETITHVQLLATPSYLYKTELPECSGTYTGKHGLQNSNYNKQCNTITEVIVFISGCLNMCDSYACVTHVYKRLDYNTHGTVRQKIESSSTRAKMEQRIINTLKQEIQRLNQENTFFTIGIHKPGEGISVSGW